MKVILSRKGFDGTNGGIPSPIMPDGTPVSMPIPSDDSDRYEDLICNGITYRQLLHDLRPGKEYNTCHLDPDIVPGRKQSTSYVWKPAFGQIDAAQSYLINTVGVQPGDLFLFFGNYRFVENVHGQFHYVRQHTDYAHWHEIQMIWGFLQIGSILTDPDDIAQYSWHPHAAQSRLHNKLNALYVPSEHLSFAQHLPGCGILPFHHDRVLTMDGMNKGTWKENPVYKPDAIIGNRKNSAKGSGVFYSGIWQELGLKESNAADSWAKHVILCRCAV